MPCGAAAAARSIQLRKFFEPRVQSLDVRAVTLWDSEAHLTHRVLSLLNTFLRFSLSLSVYHDVSTRTTRRPHMIFSALPDKGHQTPKWGVRTVVRQSSRRCTVGLLSPMPSTYPCSITLASVQQGTSDIQLWTEDSYRLPEATPLLRCRSVPSKGCGVRGCLGVPGRCLLCTSRHCV